MTQKIIGLYITLDGILSFIYALKYEKPQNGLLQYFRIIRTTFGTLLMII